MYLSFSLSLSLFDYTNRVECARTHTHATVKLSYNAVVMTGGATESERTAIHTQEVS